MNRGFTYTEIIGGRGEGRALLAYLAERYGHTSEAGWRERIEGGLVLLEGRRCDPAQVLQRRQILVWRRPPWNEPHVPLVYAVLYEDEDLLAVAKPSGLPTLPGGGFLEHTLLAVVRRRYPGASPVHRLGRGTSGIVLFARTPRGRSALSLAWREHRVTKVYRALVEGRPAHPDFTVEAPIGLVPHPALGSVYAATEGGKASKSQVRVLRYGADRSLVEVLIDTGRPHQIRIHMAACGHPLAGDPLYAAGGGFRPGSPALPGDTGYLLHAMRLALPHPATGLEFRVECRPPAGLRTEAER